jgi:NAD(P)H-dependent flavin oxidoreductase YrpB (nitropropane dioxygenase family)
VTRSINACISSDETNTVVTKAFTGVPDRVLNNTFVMEYAKSELDDLYNFSSLMISMKMLKLKMMQIITLSIQDKAYACLREIRVLKK